VRSARNLARSRYPVKVRETLFVCLALLLVMAGNHLVSPLYPLYQTRFGLTTSAITLVASVFGLSLIPAMLAAGRLADRYGRLSVLSAGLAALILGDLVFAAASSFGWLITGRLLQGLGIGAFFGPSTALASDLADPRRHDAAPLGAAVASMVGLGAGPLGAGLLVQAGIAPMVLPFVFHAGLLLVAGGLLRLAVAGGARVSRTAGPAQQVVGHDRLAMRRLVIGAGVAAWAIGGLLLSLLPTILSPALGRTSSLIGGIALFTLTAAGAAGQVAAYRWPSALALGLGGLTEALGFGLLVVALALNAVPLIVIATGLCGLGLTGVQRGGFGLLIECTPPSHKAWAISLFLACGYFAGNVLVLAFGVVADAVGSSMALRLHAAVFASLLLVLSGAVLARSRPRLAAEVSR